MIDCGPSRTGPMRPPRFVRSVALLAIVLSAGCCSVDKKTDDFTIPSEVAVNPAAIYTLAFPDAIEVAFLDWPDVTATVKIGSDGCVAVGNLSRIRVDGLTAAEASRAVAERAEVSPQRVRVRVVEYNSRQVLLYGQVYGEPRMIDYRG